MNFDKYGCIILDHSLCLRCQFAKGDPHLCSACQWVLAMDSLRAIEKRWNKQNQTNDDDYRDLIIS